jgi:hypothetical protein
MSPRGGWERMKALLFTRNKEVIHCIIVKFLQNMYWNIKRTLSALGTAITVFTTEFLSYFVI